MIKFANICLFRAKVSLLRANTSKVQDSLTECENVLAQLSTIIIPSEIKEKLERDKSD